ncbi:MAG: hypothetical protein ABIF17_05030 [Patescibacteria group bacterium]
MILENIIKPLTPEEGEKADKIKKKFDFDLYSKDEQEELINDYLDIVTNDNLRKKVETFSREDILCLAVAITLTKDEIRFIEQVGQRDVVLHDYKTTFCAAIYWVTGDLIIDDFFEKSKK